MAEQQYRVIADRDKGDDMDAAWWEQMAGDRITEVVVEPGETRVIRVERLVPTADENVYTQSIRAFVDSERPAPSLPTREQIAAVAYSALVSAGVYMPTPESEAVAEAVHALLQKGASRG